ncbi:hypothetical protein F4821DRAFT_264241 [Hypoxylon rubiginosum]|uniref:Uncharacterized protein n=1 Tax=Hypoxylon rubiginosum TaxID=110542 RepID=A0ACC0CP13_9PEZI|nr:hypothetical protein F4821DRAFT_264241 [Hypoxylon rubiginosum]
MPFFKRKVKSVKSESEGSDDSSSSLSDYLPIRYTYEGPVDPLDDPPVVSGSRGQARYPSNVPQKREQSASPAMSHTNIKKQKKRDPKTDEGFEGAFSPSHVSSRSSRSSTPGFSQNARRNPAPAGRTANMGQQRATRGVGSSDDSSSDSASDSASDSSSNSDDDYDSDGHLKKRVKRSPRSPSPDSDRSPSPVPNGKKQIKRKMWW